MLYIVGTEISTKKRDFDPRFPKKDNRVATWLPVDIDWILGRISKTQDKNTVDYMFYCADNPQRTHTTTFTNCEEADQAISVARGEKIVDEKQRDLREVDTKEKFGQVSDQLNRKAPVSTRRGGRAGNLGRRMGR